MNVALLAAQAGYPSAVVETLLAVLALPTAACLIKDLPVCRFEPERFKRFSGVVIPLLADNDISHALAYEKAARVHPTYAKLSTRWGIGLIGGWEFDLVGYESVMALVADFAKGDQAQLLGWLRYLKNLSKRLDRSLKMADWRAFVSLTSGSAGYDHLIQVLTAHYQNLQEKQLT